MADVQSENLLCKMFCWKEKEDTNRKEIKKTRITTEIRINVTAATATKRKTPGREHNKMLGNVIVKSSQWMQARE